MRPELPAAWLRALPKNASGAADVSGVYMVSGQLLGEKMTLRDTRPIEWVFDLFFEKESRPVNGHQLELRRPQADRLQAIVTRGGTVLVQTTMEVTVEHESGAVIVQRTESKGGTNLPGGYVAANTVRLWKGHDGCLYARLTTHGAGLMVVVPYVDRGEAWGRWEPATPEKVAQYAEQRERVAARRPARAGLRLPDFAEVQDMQGAPLTRAALEGKVVLLHFAPKQLQLYPARAAIDAAFRQYQSRGLEIITSWTNPAAERAVVARFIEQHALAGRHYFEMTGATNQPVLAGLFSTRPPYTLLIDRAGRIAAVNPRSNDLAVALAKLLDGN